MSRQELIERIKRHETQCRRNPYGAFCVAEVVELADGILAVRETDGGHTIYFDKTMYRTCTDFVEDLGSKIPTFPTDTGFVEDVSSRDWRTSQERPELV